MKQYDIGIDLGTTSIIIATEEQGVVFRQPTIGAVDTRTNSILAVGDEALKMVGRAPAHIDLVRPLRDGIIQDHRMTNELIVRFVNQVCRSRIFKPRIAVCVPAAITVRIIHVRIQQKGFRTQELWISTTLLDTIAYPAEQIAALYLRRWDMELCFRDLKTTMGMEELRCRSPALVQKELLAFLVAHNFIRCLIAQAASAYQVCRTRISFKGAVDAARSFHQAMRMARSQRHANRLARRLLEILARDLVPVRPGRHEPRALKRRPKPYARLTKPRHRFREAPHRGKRIQMKPGRKPCLS